MVAILLAISLSICHCLTVAIYCRSLLWSDSFSFIFCFGVRSPCRITDTTHLSSILSNNTYLHIRMQNTLSPSDIPCWHGAFPGCAVG